MRMLLPKGSRRPQSIPYGRSVGSSVNSSYRDLAVVGAILHGKHIAPNLHMTLSPGSRRCCQDG